MKSVTTLQREWIKWLLSSMGGREWLNIHIASPMNLQRLHRVTITKQYGGTEEALLNFLRKKFNEDDDIKGLWMNYKGE